jgi:hypothetical protein
MFVRSRSLAVCAVLLVSTSGALGCEAIESLRGLMAFSGEVREHLESDMKSELTDAKIDKVITVVPELRAFSETAKVKWAPDPEAADVQQIASAIGGLTEYMAFFESHGTRLTEFYVDVIKIYDARGLILLRKSQAEAREKLEAQKKELEEKKADASPEEAEKLATALERTELAVKKIDEGVEAREKARNQRKNYRLSDEEVARVEARIEDIDRVFKNAGYVKEDEPEAEDSED